MFHRTLSQEVETSLMWFKTRNINYVTFKVMNSLGGLCAVCVTYQKTFAYCSAVSTRHSTLEILFLYSFLYVIFSGARNTLKYVWKGQAESAKGSERTQLFHFDRYQLHFHRSASNYAWAQRADTLCWVMFFGQAMRARRERFFLRFSL